MTRAMRALRGLDPWVRDLVLFIVLVVLMLACRLLGIEWL